MEKREIRGSGIESRRDKEKLCEWRKQSFERALGMYTRLEPMRLKQSLFVRCIVGVAPNSLLFVVPPPYSEAKIQKFQVEEFSNKEFFCRARQPSDA
ncbi:MAG: hypothetical protein RR716_04805 [Christensenellaceae bacterium]